MEVWSIELVLETFFGMKWLLKMWGEINSDQSHQATEMLKIAVISIGTWQMQIIRGYTLETRLNDIEVQVGFKEYLS